MSDEDIKGIFVFLAISIVMLLIYFRIKIITWIKFELTELHIVLFAVYVLDVLIIYMISSVEES